MLQRVILGSRSVLLCASCLQEMCILLLKPLRFAAWEGCWAEAWICGLAWKSMKDLQMWWGAGKACMWSWTSLEFGVFILGCCQLNKGITIRSYNHRMLGRLQCSTSVKTVCTFAPLFGVCWFIGALCAFPLSLEFWVREVNSFLLHLKVTGAHLFISHYYNLHCKVKCQPTLSLGVLPYL